MDLMRWLILPLRAPLLPGSLRSRRADGPSMGAAGASLSQHSGLSLSLLFGVEGLQLLLVLILCTMPDL